MNPEVRELWTTALRSGKYKQGESFLKDGDSFCCLGVLCDIAAQEGIVKSVKEIEGLTYYDEDNAVLPESVMRWSGITSRPAEYREDGHALTIDNDEGKSFADIADIIEEKF